MSRPPRSGATPSLVALLLAVGLLLAGCSTGNDAVATGGDFQFVAPGRQQVIHYEPPEARGTLRRLSGESLLEPGRQIGIQDYPNQVVVINIWGSWCGPCRTEVSDLQQLYQNTRARGVTMLGIDIRDSYRDAAADFVHDQKLTYPSIYDPPGRSLDGLRGYPRNVVPSTIVLDRQHRVAVVFLTVVRIGQLAPVVQQLAAEPTS